MFNMTNANSYMQMAMMNPQFTAAFQQQQQQQQQQTSTVAGGTPFPGAVGFNYPPGYYQQPQQYTPVKLDGMNSVSVNKGSASGKTTGTRTSRKRKSDVAARVCVNCQCTSSPFWRKERNGEGSLCNACGLYFAKNNSPRPVGLWKRERNGNTLAVKEARLQQQQQEQLAAQQQQQQNGDKKGAPATSVPPNNTSEEGGDKQQQNDSGSGRQNQKTASNEAGSDGTKTESVEKANQSGGNSSDENNEKKGASEENTDDENEYENKSEVKRAKVVLEMRGERVVVRVSESVERVLRECEEE